MKQLKHQHDKAGAEYGPVAWTLGARGCIGRDVAEHRPVEEGLSRLCPWCAYSGVCALCDAIARAYTPLLGVTRSSVLDEGFLCRERVAPSHEKQRLRTLTLAWCPHPTQEKQRLLAFVP